MAHNAQVGSDQSTKQGRDDSNVLQFDRQLNESPDALRQTQNPNYFSKGSAKSINSQLLEQVQAQNEKIKALVQQNMQITAVNKSLMDRLAV